MEYFKKEWPEIYKLKWFSDEEMEEKYRERYKGDQIPIKSLMVDYHRLYSIYCNKEGFISWLKDDYIKID